MRRRDVLKTAASIPAIGWLLGAGARPIMAAVNAVSAARARVRPGQPGWPSAADWEALKLKVGGRLVKPVSPFATCASAPENEACTDALKRVKNPYFLGDQVGLTQTSEWVGAWASVPSAYAVAAETTADVVAAVNFAREHNLRLVVKGGGHSYQGTSCAPDSLLIWTRHMNDVTLHDAFVAEGCDGKQEPQPAVTIGAGAMWIDAYDAVTTHGGRYVQGGGCTTVGVAGLVQSGGFGSFSKRYGTAAAGLIEAEVVTADGQVRTVNKCLNPDLFWAIKGGGGGTFGVVTRLTLRTRELPDTVGAVLVTLKAATDDAFRALIEKALGFYGTALMNPHWGEKMTFRPDNTLVVEMLFQGLSEQQARETWVPFLDWARSKPEYSFVRERYVSVPARHFWDAAYMREHVPDAFIADDRHGAPPYHVFWGATQGEVGQVLYGYKSAWIPAGLLEPARLPALADALFASTRHWQSEFHCGKGLAGTPAEDIAAARNTATNPDVLDAFALVIIAADGPPAFPGLPGRTVDKAVAQHIADRITKAMDELLRVAPRAGSYVSESDYFETNWQEAYWGTNYPRLARIKQKYDPTGLFFVHHGAGTENWSTDGFTRLQN